MVAISGALTGVESQRALAAGGNAWNLLTLIRYSTENHIYSDIDKFVNFYCFRPKTCVFCSRRLEDMLAPDGPGIL